MSEATAAKPIILPNGEIKVYTRRHFVLLSYALSMFAWNLSTGRQIAIVPTYAQYHDTTNEVSSIENNLGIDSWAVVDNAVLLFSYFIGSYAIDRWGLQVMILGSFMLAISAWLWFVAGTNPIFVLLARALGSCFGPLVSSALLAISNRWYPEKERAKATAIGSLINVLGAGAALVLSPLFATESDDVVDLNLRSCEVDDALTEFPTLQDDFDLATQNSTFLFCKDDLVDLKLDFCCYLPVDLEFLNLVMAFPPTLAFIFTLLSVRNLPPTPPSKAAEPKDFVGLIKGMKMLFSNQRFAKLALSDFLVSGPPLVLIAALSRLFPPQVADLSFIASAAGLAISLPIAVITGHYLDKTHAYWTFTMAGYAIGTVFWFIGTLSFAIDTVATAYIFLGCIVFAIAAYVAWQVAVYETKLEYVFSHHTNLEGWIVGSDRVVINLSALIFTLWLVPERVGGALNTFIIGAVIMAVGCIPTYVIRDRYAYLRAAWDASEREDVEEAEVVAKVAPADL